VEFRILGPLEIVAEGRPVELGGAKERALVALLLLSPNRVVSTDQLVEELWEGAAPDRASASVRVRVSRLRKALAASGPAGASLIQTQAPGYRLRVEPGQYDAANFEARTAAARSLLDAEQDEEAASAFRDALAMWRGTAFADITGPPSVHAEATRLEEARVAALEDRVEADLRCGRHGSLVAELEALVAAYPLRERLWGQRIIALYRSRRQADALRAYQKVRTLLRDELGIEPAPPLRQLEQAVLAQDPALDWVAPAALTLPAPSAQPELPTPTLPTGVVTFLLTDVEGSATLWEAHPRVMADALARHDAIIGAVVAEHHGVMLKTRGEGDSTFSVFARASDAAAAALTMQRALGDEPWPEGCAMSVRMAIHTGEALERAGDYFGPTVNRAAAIRSLAAGGQVLCSQSAAELLVDHLGEDAGLIELGDGLALPGLGRTERVFALFDRSRGRGDAQANMTDFELSLPAGLSGDGRLFVGRAREVERLGGWREGSNVGGRAVLVAGEPGIGKTRLLAEVAGRAHQDGALVLYGRCDEEMFLPFQPFVEALAAYVAACPPPILQAQSQSLGGELTRLLPQLVDLLPTLPPPLPAEPDTERYRLFEAVSAFMISVAEQRRLVLVLDDLQWADKPTLLLLRHLLRAASESPLWVVGAYRDNELTRTDPLAEVLADLRREQLVERVSLTGLSPDEVTEMLQAIAGDGLPDGLASTLHRETEGNPFFLEEVVRHLIETGAADPERARWPESIGLDTLGIPEGVRDVVGRRLLHLSPDANAVLTLASALGREFGLDILERASDLPGDRIVEALEEATAATLINEVAGAPTRYAFSHVLIRETLYGELTTARRARLHRRVAEAMEETAGNDDRLAELARHFFEAAQAGDIDRAVTYCRRAGDRALGVLAYEEAAGHYERALHALELERHPDDALRGELLLAVGDAWWRAGAIERSTAAFAQATDLARTTGRSELLARAVLGPGLDSSSGEGLNVHGTEDGRVELIEEALDALPEADSALRAKLLSRYVIARYWSAPREQRLDLSAQAVAIAERTDDREALLSALVARRFALWGPDDIAERAATATEILHLAEAARHPDRALEARLYRVVDLLEQGNIEAADREITIFQHGARELRRPYFIWYASVLPSMRALIDGRFDEAEKLATEALAIGEAAQEAAALTTYGATLLFVSIEQGRMSELQGAMAAIADIANEMPVVKTAQAYLALELGQLEEARAGFDRLASHDFADIPQDIAFFGNLVLLAQTCAGLGDARRAAILYDKLAPFRGRNIMVFLQVCLGPSDLYLGMLARTMAQTQTACEHFEAAIDMAQSMGSLRFEAHARFELALALLQRKNRGDRKRAADLVDMAQGIATKLGMVTLNRHIAAHRPA
jgi:DNA-binding SARP family transcriptional activator